MNRTKKVRIAVAVSESGEWTCYGYGFSHDEGPDDEEKKAEALEGLQEGADEEIRVSMVEADVPLPEPVRTVQGRVE